MKKITKRKIVSKKIGLRNYYPLVELAVQRYWLIKKAVCIKHNYINKEMDWVMDTFKEIDKESMTTCGYLTIKAFIDEDKKQKIEFYFDLASN